MTIETMLTLRVLARIQMHSIRSPITGGTLAKIYGIDIRHVQHIVEDLRDAGHKIGANQSPPRGYFLAKGPDEMFETAELLRDRGRTFFARAARLMNFGGNQRTVWEQETELGEGT